MCTLFHSRERYLINFYQVFCLKRFTIRSILVFLVTLNERYLLKVKLAVGPLQEFPNNFFAKKN
jgi:hypothetical protein